MCTSALSSPNEIIPPGHFKANASTDHPIVIRTKMIEIFLGFNVYLLVFPVQDIVHIKQDLRQNKNKSLHGVTLRVLHRNPNLEYPIWNVNDKLGVGGSHISYYLEHKTTIQHVAVNILRSCNLSMLETINEAVDLKCDVQDAGSSGFHTHHPDG